MPAAVYGHVKRRLDSEPRVDEVFGAGQLFKASLSRKRARSLSPDDLMSLDQVADDMIVSDSAPFPFHAPRLVSYNVHVHSARCAGNSAGPEL